MEADRPLSSNSALNSIRDVLRNALAGLRFGRERQRFVRQLLERNRELESSLDRRRRNEAHLRRLSLIDGLTGIYNRRGFDQALELEWQRALRAQEPLSLIMIDIDCFKAFNDRYGHPVGDGCLQQVAQELRCTLRRPGDLVARYGGEEFVALLPNTTCAGAILIGEEMRHRIVALAIPHQASVNDRCVTISAGLATITPGAADGQRSQALLRQADQALYAAKDGGRNRLNIFVAGNPQRHP